MAMTGSNRASAGPSASRRPRAGPIVAISGGPLIASPLGGSAHLAVNERDPEQIPPDAQREAQRRAHAGPAPVGPPDRHNGVPVAALTCEVDDFDVEHDAGGLLAGKHVAGDITSEPLEPAL